MPHSFPIPHTFPTPAHTFPPYLAGGVLAQQQHTGLGIKVCLVDGCVELAEPK